jgi:pimeloyl-ACP methyl ester carboxylesterase
MIDYAYATAHQPGAANAPFAFLAGRLFSRDIRNVYEALPQPVWLAHGTKGDFGDFSEAGWAMARPNWRVEAFPTGALPHFEQPDRFAAKLEAFLTGP